MESHVPEKDTSVTQTISSWFHKDRIFTLDPLKIALIYLVLGFIWILCSDWVLLALVPDEREYAILQSVKGIIFILVMALLLFVLIRHFTRQWQEKSEELRVSNEQIRAREDELRIQYEDLARGKAEWETTYNAISDWVSLISPDGRILKTNRGIESLVGIPADQAIGRNCFELVHGTSCPTTECPRIRMLESRQRETMDMPKPKGKGWLQVTVDPVFDSTGNLVSAIHVVRDISERMQEQKALDQAKKKLHLLNYVTFNEIQNALFTLWGFQQFVKDRITESPVRSVFVKEEELLNQISQSLKFAQAYQNLGLKPPLWQDVKQVFLLAISHLDFLTMKHVIQLDGLEIFSDPLLEQVLVILADNTLVHGKTATQVTLRYTEDAEAVTIFFEDDGVGITDTIRDRIFSPDFQKTRSIGLFLAREILEITGITIRETGTPGKGARFEIIIPRGAYRFPGRKEKQG